ncbi:pleckstrin homology domain-containing family O member 1-like [Cynoglossus semilaevis]|uniref:Pleckstrin homology domain containing, family O member 1b n=1 Tax=Cynoglossus semilaevis TaxID=244447 RepID=A0A3P8WZ20_CYNSE|nr:pleckstrin homology domain-containing family O member 1-like [Cynoglossus semilaevis]
MKKNSGGKQRGPQDTVSQNLQPDKVGWIRKFCGKGIFREIWKNRVVVLRGDQLFICEKEVKDLGRAEDVLDLCDYERCEEVRKNKSRSKKSHSKFRLQRCSSPGNTVPNLLFLAVSPQEKELWINALNVSITRAKNRILDEVTVDDSQLFHLTRDRAKIPHNRRLPTRGHLLAVASTSSSVGTLTLDLIQEEDVVSRHEFPVDVSPESPRSKADNTLFTKSTKNSEKSQSLPRDVVVAWELTPPEKNRCASMEEIPSNSERKATMIPRPQVLMPRPQVPAVEQLQELISQKLRRTQELLEEVHVEHQQREENEEEEEKKKKLTEVERLLKEAAASWSQAQEVLEEVKELRSLYNKLDSSNASSSITPPSNSSKLKPESKNPVG